MLQLRRQLLACLAVMGLSIGGLLATGCLGSPTLPLPPPSPETPTVPVNGQTRLAGSVPVHNLGVNVLALNLRTNKIYGESTSTNRYSFLADAVSGDTFMVWYTAGDEASETAEVSVPYPIGGTPNNTPPESTEDAGAGDAG